MRAVNKTESEARGAEKKTEEREAWTSPCEGYMDVGSLVACGGEEAGESGGVGETGAEAVELVDGGVHCQR